MIAKCAAVLLASPPLTSPLPAHAIHARVTATRPSQRSPVTKFYLDKTREERNEQLSKLSQQNAPLSVAGSAAYLRTLPRGCWQVT